MGDCHGQQIAAMQLQIDKLRIMIEKLAEHEGVSLDYQPHTFQANPLPDEEDGEEGVGNV
jgi:hypothetical protein